MVAVAEAHAGGAGEAQPPGAAQGAAWEESDGPRFLELLTAGRCACRRCIRHPPRCRWHDDRRGCSSMHGGEGLSG
ncbi:uncharacterized protein A4U43_C01F180 [Asparagus officinalis]|uniref:Uncharacterized protein n=1 Tax=Asparagus officinalis TaxID=4686 RepID=A0A5P1FN40_ASPOF|nr:uncharacterized protein A4U43_C01F180 [Asparagus officinalis]